MTLRPIAPGSAQFRAFEAALAQAGLPTEDLFAEPSRYYAQGAADDDDASAFGGLLLLGEEALLRSVAVPRASQGVGRGRALVSELVDLAAGGGARRLWLLTTTAEGYFAKLGWRVVDRTQAPAAVAATRQFTTVCPASAVLMCRKLS